MQSFRVSPGAMLESLIKNRRLILALTKREVIGRYRGSALGILWSLFNPIFMLAVYTFVFSIVFRAKWGGGNQTQTEFALVLFAGLIVFNLFAECFNRAPTLIISNANYVKKVVFPLEVLPWVALGSSLFHALVSVVVWLLFYIFVVGIPHWTVLLTPLVLVPMILFTVGVSWLLASLGVYLRDVGQIVGILTTVLMFVSPIFFPISALPAKLQPLLSLNPLASPIAQIRDVLYWGVIPNPMHYVAYLVGAAVIACLGFAWFQKTRKGFADVL
ncbi:ABC transporter permease [Candidimonas humi]|uniref:Transport permease protein n=1 Tax=Candidimonas humi TaxID=683355 RepID=A0ABV8NXW2_9BURK|nr:ABC transporter permease [Candidimonas humi]MBV6304444.1 ABC transporter permease [Candidimonas humi]